MNEDSCHAADKSTRNPARVQGRASVGPAPNLEFAGKASAPDLHSMHPSVRHIALRGAELQTGIFALVDNQGHGPEAGSHVRFSQLQVVICPWMAPLSGHILCGDTFDGLSLLTDLDQAGLSP